MTARNRNSSALAGRIGNAHCAPAARIALARVPTPGVSGSRDEQVGAATISRSGAGVFRGHVSMAADPLAGAAAICPVQPGGDSGVTPSSVLALLLLAEGEVNPLGGIVQLAFPVVLIFFMYIMLIQRPQKREQEKRQLMLAALKKNDHVLLSSGIYGVITNVREDGDELTVRVDETSGAKLRVTRAAIAKVISDEPVESTTGGK